MADMRESTKGCGRNMRASIVGGNELQHQLELHTRDQDFGSAFRTGALIKVDMGNGPFEGRGNVVFDLFWIYKIRLDLYKIAIRIDDPGIITLHSGKRCETRM